MLSVWFPVASLACEYSIPCSRSQTEQVSRWITALSADQPATEANVLMARQSLWMNGLKRLYLFSAADWPTLKSVPQDVVLLDRRQTPDVPVRVSQEYQIRLREEMKRQ